MRDRSAGRAAGGNGGNAREVGSAVSVLDDGPSAAIKRDLLGPVVV